MSRCEPVKLQAVMGLAQAAAAAVDDSHVIPSGLVADRRANLCWQWRLC